VQQDHAHARRVGLAVELLDERGARTAATLPRLDEREHQVGGGRLPGNGRDPARGLGPLRRQQPDGLPVALREPGPRFGPGDQPGGLLLERAEGAGPFGYLAEKRVPPDDFKAKPCDRAGIARPGPPNLNVTERTAASLRPSRYCPGRENLQRCEPVAQQHGDAVNVAAGPVDHRCSVRIAGAGDAGQVFPPPSEQPVKAAGDVGTGNLGRQPEPARGSPGQLQAVRRTRPVLTATGRGRPPVGPAYEKRRAATGRRGPRHVGRQQRVDPPPALQHLRTYMAHLVTPVA